jgi:hypothetical protein
MLPSLAFTQNDAVAAFNAWHCNCGPAALAASLGLTLDQVKPAVMSVGFADKHYVNPTMMRGGPEVSRCHGVGVTQQLVAYVPKRRPGTHPMDRAVAIDFKTQQITLKRWNQDPVPVSFNALLDWLECVAEATANLRGAT